MATAESSALSRATLLADAPILPRAIPIIVQVPAAVVGLVAASLYRDSTAAIQGAFAVSVLAVAWYALKCVPIPSFFHYFVAAYVPLFMLYPIAAPFIHPRLLDSPRIAAYVVLTISGIHLFTLAHAASVRPVEGPVRAVPNDRLLLAVYVLSALNVLGAAMMVVDAGSISALASAGRIEQKINAGPARVAALLIGYSGSVAYSLLPLALRRSPVLAFPVIPVLWAVEIVLFLGFRIRSWPVAHAVGLIVGALYLLPAVEGHAGARGLLARLRQTALLVVAASVVVVGATVLRFARGAFESSGASAFSSIGVGYALQRSLLNGDLGYTPTTLAAMERVPEERDYLYGQSYYRLLFTVIPRSIWPEKPENTQRVVAGWLTPDRPEQTIPPGVQGDLYINFGIYGVLGFFFYGVVFAILDRLKGLLRYLFLGAAFVPVFHMVRGGFTNAVLLLTTTGVTAWVVTRYLQGDGQYELRPPDPPTLFESRRMAFRR